MDGDAARWDDRYDGADDVEPAPPDALVGRDDLLALVPAAGRALDVAAGLGAQTVWMARRGLDVLALDVSPLAIAAVERSARRHGVDERVTTVVADLDDGLPAAGLTGSPDDGRRASTDTAPGFDVVVCQRFRDPSLYGPIVEALRPGGLAVVTVLSEVGVESPGPFHAPPGELAETFGALDVELLSASEGDGEASVVIRRPG